MEIYFVYHSTSLDNENGIASGWNDVELSERGVQESEELGNGLVDISLDLVVCSDLRRAVNTAEIAFGDEINIIIDKRMREINYGDFNGKPIQIVEEMRKDCIREPFPSGESYAQVIMRVHESLYELKDKYPGKTALIIGHRATRYGLETLVNCRTIEECIETSFQPKSFWKYDW